MTPIMVIDPEEGFPDKEVKTEAKGAEITLCMTFRVTQGFSQETEPSIDRALHVVPGPFSHRHQSERGEFWLA